jgi:hypothetical protein
MSLLLLVLLLLIIFGGLPELGLNQHYGYAPSGVGLLILIIVLLFLFGGRFRL